MFLVGKTELSKMPDSSLGMDQEAIVIHLTLIRQRGGGWKWPAANQNNHFSGTKIPIDLKPGCIFKSLKGPFWPGSPKIRVDYRIHFGSMMTGIRGAIKINLRTKFWENFPNGGGGKLGSGT